MAGSGKKEFVDDHADRSNGDGFSETSPSQARSLLQINAENSCGESRSVSRDQEFLESESRLTDRLTDVLLNNGDGDLLLQGSEREGRVLQWLQALDMQVLGACRADERLRPLLKPNVSSGMAEDCLLSHLSQYFEPVEVGMLARCFCIPLVSIRVGKINKRGSLMRPTDARGNLSLTLLPTSYMRLSFHGDNGQTQRLFTFGSKALCGAVVIEEIPADNSGRSFVIKMPDGRALYYWCCEKSKLLGTELLSKMKDLIKRRPSIAELTGINESRLGCFASHFRVYLLGSTVGRTTLGASSASLDASSDLCGPSEPESMSLKSLRSRHSGSQSVKSHSFHQGNLSPRSSSFKDGTSRNSPSRSVRDKLRRLGDSHLSVIETTGLSASANTYNLCQTGSREIQDVKSDPLATCSVESRLIYTGPLTTSPETHLSVAPPVFTPYYCWCPPSESSLQQSFQGTPSPEELPPLSSLIPATPSPSLFMPSSPIDLADVPPLNLSPLLQDPILRLPISSSQPIPTFTPLMCDPIVHVPFIDVCSSGQGYLVSAGPAISASIPPLHHPKLANPVCSENDSLVEKGARETLRLLISGSGQTNISLRDAFPSVRTRTEERPSAFVTGSRGLYSGSIDTDSSVGNISPVGLSTPRQPQGGQIAKSCGMRGEPSFPSEALGSSRTGSDGVTDPREEQGG